MHVYYWRGARITAYLVALSVSPQVSWTDVAVAQQCKLNQRQIIFSYAPQLCTQPSCIRTQKLLVLGSKVMAYFKKGGSNETFRSLGPGDATNADLAVGFQYDLSSASDVLHDPAQAQGIQRATAQLSPGSSYLTYRISASQRGDILKLEDLADIDLKFVGRVKSEVTTSIEVENCDACRASVVVTQVINGIASTFQLPVGVCNIYPIQ